MRKTRSDKGIKRKVTFPELLEELREGNLISEKAYKTLSSEKSVKQL
jgi:hypothetical protein